MGTQAHTHPLSKRQIAAIDRQIEAFYYRHCAGIAIDMLAIPTIFEAGRRAALAGEDIGPAILAAVAAARR